MTAHLSKPPSAYPSWLRAALLVLPLAMMACIALVWVTGAWGPGDAIVYLAAGERLNADHDLYALVPGDRPVMLLPPFWTVPLLSPPAIAVIWRPLAALPAVWTVTLWWVTMIGATGVSVTLLYRRAFLPTGLLLLALAVPIAIVAGAGNVDALRILGVIAIWLLVQRQRDGAAGVILGLLIVVKLTPVLLLWWLIVTWRPRAIAATLATVAVGMAVSLIGAGLDTHLRYLEVVRQTYDTGTSLWTLAGVTRAIGIAPEIARYAPTAALALLAFAMVPLRRRPRLTFAMAVLAMVAGSPAGGGHSWSVLIAALAPAAWPTPEIEVRDPWRMIRTRRAGPLKADLDAA